MNGDPSTQHPTKTTILMHHAVFPLEMSGQSLLMGGNLLFDSFSVRVMDPVKPFSRSVPDFSFFIAQHGLPTSGEMHNVGRKDTVPKPPVPQAIVGATSRQGIALFAFLQCFLRLFV